MHAAIIKHVYIYIYIYTRINPILSISTLLILLEKQDFVARVINSIFCEIRVLQGSPLESC